MSGAGTNTIEVNVQALSSGSVFVFATAYSSFAQQAVVTLTKVLDTNGNSQSFTPWSNTWNNENNVGEGVYMGGGSLNGTAGYTYFFSVVISHKSGGNWIASTDIQKASMQQVTIGETLVFSEDATDKDLNDCVVSFRTFATGS